MSQAEVERFVADLKADEEMRGELKNHAAGIASVVSFASDKGYDLSPDEVRDYIQSQLGRELDDAELEAVAGGKGHHHHHTTSVAAYQSVAAMTTEAAVAETTAYTIAEAATSVAAAAEVVAVAAIVAT